MNPWDVILSVVIVTVLVLAVRRCVRARQRGCHSCGGDCCGSCRCRCERPGK